MSRDEIFRLWPRPWRLSDLRSGMVLDAHGYGVAEVDRYGRKSIEQRVAFAQMLVEWSQEKP